MDNKLYTTISNNIEENNNKYSSNEIFGLLSVLALLEITEIFQLNYSRLPEKQQNLPAPAGINNPANLITLLSQLQGGAEGNSNLKQLLPLLLTVLGGNNRGNLDLNQIGELLNSLKNNREKNNNEEIRLIENEEEEREEDSKKKILSR